MAAHDAGGQGARYTTTATCRCPRVLAEVTPLRVEVPARLVFPLVSGRKCAIRDSNPEPAD